MESNRDIGRKISINREKVITENRINADRKKGSWITMKERRVPWERLEECTRELEENKPIRKRQYRKA